MSFCDYNNFVEVEQFLRVHPYLIHQVAKTQLSIAAAMLMGKLVDLEVISAHDVGLCARLVFPTICLPGRLRALHCMIWFSNDKICRHSGLSWMIDMLKELDEKIGENPGAITWMAEVSTYTNRIRTALDYYLDRQIVKTSRSTPKALAKRIKRIAYDPSLSFHEE